MMHIKDRLIQLKYELENTGDEAYFSKNNIQKIVELLLSDLEQDEKENKQWFRRLRKSINGIRDIICNTDEIKIATLRVQAYMREHGSDEEFIQNINNDFVLGFMISQRMMHDDFQVVWEEYLESSERWKNESYQRW